MHSAEQILSDQENLDTNQDLGDDNTVGSVANVNELTIVNFVQKQVREDLNSCCDAIYSGSPLDDYFEILLRVQSRL